MRRYKVIFNEERTEILRVMLHPGWHNSDNVSHLPTRWSYLGELCINGMDELDAYKKAMEYVLRWQEERRASCANGC